MGTDDHKDKAQDLEAMVSVPVEDQVQMVLERLVDDQLMEDL